MDHTTAGSQALRQQPVIRKCTRKTCPKCWQELSYTTYIRHQNPVVCPWSCLTASPPSHGDSSTEMRAVTDVDSFTSDSDDSVPSAQISHSHKHLDDFELQDKTIKQTTVCCPPEQLIQQEIEHSETSSNTGVFNHENGVVFAQIHIRFTLSI